MAETPTLNLNRGADNDVEIALVDEESQPLSLAGVQFAKIAVREHAEGAELLSSEVQFGAGALTLDVPLKFGDPLYSVLTPGTYVADVTLTFDDADKRRATDKFLIHVVDVFSGEHE
jgi:hypothetical protein